MTIELNERESLLIITALGVYQNRTGQKARWSEKKRMITLRSRLADCITIGDDTEAARIRSAMNNVHREVEKRNRLGLELIQLRDRVKEYAGITDEKLSDVDNAFSIFTKKVYEIGLKYRTIRILKEYGIETVADMVRLNETDLRMLKNFGHVSMNDVKAFFEKHDLTFNMDV